MNKFASGFFGPREEARSGRLAFAWLGAACLALAGAEPAHAGVQGGANSCIANEFGGAVGCTANDVTIADVTVLSVVDGCTGPSDTATVQMRLTVEIGAAKRYRPAFWISTDGGNAESGTCFKEFFPPPLLAAPSLADLQTGHGPYADLDSDACGDAEQNDVAIDPIYRIVSTAADSAVPYDLTIPCRDSNSDGIIDFDYCAGWLQNADGTCTGIAQAGIPGNSSKCKCGLVSLFGIIVPPDTLFDGVLVVDKKVMIAGGTCGVDDVQGPLNLPTGTQVEFCYYVSAFGTAETHEAVLNVQLVDDMATASTGDDETITLVGLTDVDDDTDLDDLAPGQTATGKSSVVTLP